MKKKGFRSVRRNKRRTMQTGGGHIELITSILLEDLPDVRANIANLRPNEKNAEAQFNELFQFAQGRTALYLACRLPIPNPGIVKLLLDNGFSPNSRNNVRENLGNGAYPLHGVVQAIKETVDKDDTPNFNQSLEIIQLLKAKGADLGVKNSSTSTSGTVGMTAYDEYLAYVKPTTSKFFKINDLELDTALKPPPPGPPSTPVLLPRGRPQYSGVPTGQGAAVLGYYAPSAAAAVLGQSHSITIQPTQSLTPGYSLPTGIDPTNVFVLHPSLVTFQRMIGGKRKDMILNYNGGVIKLPDNGGDFNGIHLQVLARNESLNVDGIMRTSLYGGVLSVEEIATIRCLVKNTTVVGLTYPEKNGGYPQGKNPIVPIPRKPTIIVDQCGLQWQNSIYNTGALFFYPTGLDDNIEIYEGTDQGTKTTLGKYKRWQNATYWEMYGVERPPVGAADPDATWVIQDVKRAVRTKLVGKLKSPVVGFKTEFMQAFDSVRFMAHREESITNVHFKFLRAGLGFFSENILLTGDQMGVDAKGLTLAPNRTAFLETARLEGIRDGIMKLGGASAIMASTKIQKIILPFQTFTIPDMKFGAFLVSSSEDALAQNAYPNITIATTNCADPHAGPGNEGGYHSVDAAIASNTYVHHLNAAFNYAHIQSMLFENIGPVVPPVHVQPPAAHGSAQYVPLAYHLPGAAIYPYSPGAAARSFAAVASIHPPSIRPGSPRGQQGCWDPVKRVWTNFCAKFSRRNSVAPGPEGGSGGRNRNRKQQKHQKPRATRKYKNKNKNKKHSRRS